MFVSSQPRYESQYTAAGISSIVLPYLPIFSNKRDVNGTAIGYSDSSMSGMMSLTFENDLSNLFYL